MFWVESLKKYQHYRACEAQLWLTSPMTPLVHVGFQVRIMERLLFPVPEDLPDPEIKPDLCAALAGVDYFLPLCLLGSPKVSRG